VSWKRHFSRCLEAAPGRLHFAAHSHHPWPDVSFDAQQRAWLDAAERLDVKWERVMEEVLPRAQRHVARILSLTDPATVAFAPNTHELVVRLVSCIERRPVRVLTTDGEFHSFERQLRRWEEAGRVVADRVRVEPFATFSRRFRERAEGAEHDLVHVSQVFFNSGFVLEDLAGLAEAASPGELVLVDGYHAFFALPVDLGAVADRLFWVAGGYKYAMSGEGVCFLHCPPGLAERPVDTGWFAGFASLDGRRSAEVDYAEGGGRFLGATFDPTALYRFNAVMDLWEAEGVTASVVHEHARALQERFLERLDGLGMRALHPGRLVPDRSVPDRANFLTFRSGDAGTHQRVLREHGIIVDSRGDRLRFGFGIYHDPEDVDELAERLGELLG